MFSGAYVWTGFKYSSQYYDATPELCYTFKQNNNSYSTSAFESSISYVFYSTVVDGRSRKSHVSKCIIWFRLLVGGHVSLSPLFSSVVSYDSDYLWTVTWVSDQSSGQVIIWFRLLMGSHVSLSSLSWSGVSYVLYINIVHKRQRYSHISVLVKCTFWSLE